MNNLVLRDKIKNGILKTLLNIFFIFLTVFAIYPVFWMIYSSLKSEKQFNTDIIGLPTELHFENYASAIKIGHLDTYLFNSIYVTLVCVVLIVVFSFLVAYFINRFTFRGRRLIYGLFMMGMMIPVHGFLVPLYIQFSRLNMTNEWFSLFLPITAFNLPLSMILIENFLKGISFEIEESALIDGASLGQRLSYVVLPMCAPILATITILSFLWVWNEYPFALVMITADKLKTLMLGISNFRGERSTQYPQMFAALTMVCIPIIVVYSAFSQRIMQGMTAGAVKG